MARRLGRYRPRSVRGRLVAVYTAAALLLGLAAAVLFTLQLRAGLRTSLDVALDARMAPLVAALSQPGSPDLPDSPPTVARRPQPAGSVEALTVVYDPTGRVVDSQPLALSG